MRLLALAFAAAILAPASAMAACAVPHGFPWVAGQCLDAADLNDAFNNRVTQAELDAALAPLATTAELGVTPYVCTGTAATDTAGIQAAINARQTANGGLVVLTPGLLCAINATLTINKSNVGISCPAGGGRQPGLAPTATTGCHLKWQGSSGGTILSAIAPSGAVSNAPLLGNVLQGIYFDGNAGLAANGVLLRSVRYGAYKDLAFVDFTGGYDLDVNVVHATSTTFSSNCDTQRNIFDTISFANYTTTSTALRLGTWLDTSLTNGGCDASFNIYKNLDFGIFNGKGILFDGGDNETFISTRIRRETGGTGVPVDFSIYVDGSLTYPAQGNLFKGLASNVAPIARGTTTFPSCVPYAGTSLLTNCTWGNTIEQLDRSNASPDPTIEAGADLNFSTSDGAVVLGSAAGGNKGNGTLNAKGLYINGMSAGESGVGNVTAADTLASPALVVGQGAETIATEPKWTISSNQLTGNLNTGSLNATTGVLRLGAADGVVTSLGLQSFGAENAITSLTSGGTSAAKTATQANDTLFAIRPAGYTGSGFTFNKVVLDARARENFTPSAAGTQFEISTTPLGSTTASLVATFNNDQIITPSTLRVDQSSGATQGLWVTQDFTGTDTSSPFYANYLQFDDSFDAGTNFKQAMGIIHNFGNDVSGGVQSLAVYGYLDSPTASANTNRNYVAVNANATARTGDGGTAPTAVDSKGAIFGMGINGVACGTAISGNCSHGAATNLREVTGGEVNVGVLAGASVYYKGGWTIAGLSEDAVRGSVIDCELCLSNLPGAVGWHDGIFLSNSNGQHPLSSDGAVLRSVGGTYAKGISLLEDTISEFAFESPGFSVSGNGSVLLTLLQGVDNSAATYPGSASTAWAITDNFSSGAAEVNFWNRQDTGGGFDFYQKTGASAATKVAAFSATGVLTMPKGTTFTAPGAGFGALQWVAGTNAGTCKLVALAGTSNTPTTIVDNVGAGC